MTADIRPLFEDSLVDGEYWYTVLLEDLLPEWGEGGTKGEAVRHLARSVLDAHDGLHDEPNERLAERLQYQRDFLCALLHPEAAS